MNHQVESVKPERVDRRRGKSAEPGPGVVGVDGPVGEAEPRQIEGDPRKPRDASSVTTLRYRNDEAGTPCRQTTGSPDPSSRTKLPIVAAVKRRPERRWASMTASTAVMR
jgi:hypothetical protein